MGARGPKPSEHSVTRHAPKQQPKTMTAEAPAVPDLVGEFSFQTLAWWDAWIASPQTEFFAATDWQTLLRLAPLVEMYFKEPKPQLAAEIRQTEAKLGATASDRDRLGWKITPPAAAPADGAEPEGARDRPDPRRAK
jgi:hypothetical protein